MKYLLSIILNVAVGQKCRRSKWQSVKNSVGQNGRQSKLPSVKNSVGRNGRQSKLRRSKDLELGHPPGGPYPETPGFLAISGPRKPQGNFSFRPGAFGVDFSVILEEFFF
jgi:hypothetical protein